jgi:branched-chain amino acid transport system permease protein
MGIDGTPGGGPVSAYITAMLILACIYALLALGLNIHWGYTGLVNFGHVAFFAIGAYTSALTSTTLGWPIAGSFIAAIFLAGVSAWPLGLVTIRLRTDYLAIVTLGFSEVVRALLINEKWLTNGTNGISYIPRPFQNLPTGTNEPAFLVMMVLILGIAFGLVGRLTGAPFGRTLQAIRENEEAAQSLGKHVTGFKTRSFVIGAAMAGAAGAAYAHYINFVVPDQFLPLVTFYVWMAVILGGSGSNTGVILGTVVLMVFLEGSRFAKDFIPFVSEVKLAALRLMLVGLGMILFILYRPQGVIGHKDE